MRRLESVGARKIARTLGHASATCALPGRTLILRLATRRALVEHRHALLELEANRRSGWHTGEGERTTITCDGAREHEHRPKAQHEAESRGNIGDVQYRFTGTEGQRDEVHDARRT